MSAYPAMAQKSALAGRRFAPSPLSRLLLTCLVGLTLAGKIACAQENTVFQLDTALARYRQLGADPAIQAAWDEPLPPWGASGSRKLEPGKPYAGLPILMRRLIALGDLPPDTAVPARYEAPVTDGVMAFQRRHGLEPDGVIGKDTLSQLNVPPLARMHQIELNLERLRQSPLPVAPRLIVVNIPEFILRTYATEGGQPVLKTRMKIIVGNARGTRTPVFTEDMRYIEFSPYWNIPPSIARKETIPKLRRDPQYFAEQGFEFYTSGSTVITSLTNENLEAVLSGKMRIRQRPGTKNALGGIKFAFPNRDNIYMHHTPATQLFAHVRRDFSHGCIRVEEPLALARFVLQDAPEWNDERLLAAMTRGRSATLRLKEPLPVVITYFTASADEDGRVHFFPDLYGRDAIE